MTEFGLDLRELRDKWREVPQHQGRVFSSDLLLLDDKTFFEDWERNFATYQRSPRWEQTMYKEFMGGKSVLEIGSGLGYDGTLRLQQGLVKDWTFCDIVESNLQYIERVCRHRGLAANFVLIDNEFACFEKLGMFDVVWASGSLINVPFQLARTECMKILPHLKPGGRWIELCYPRERWVREGRLPFSEWGKVTDGERTPWVEWYDLVKIKRRLFPAPLKVILDFNFHNASFNWFDLLLASETPFDPTRRIFDIDVFPAGSDPKNHNGTDLVRRHGALEFVTPELLWSYAVSFDLAAAIAKVPDDIGPVDHGFTIEVELHVSAGEIGVLIVGDDMSTSVCEETMVAASTEPATLMITVPPQAGANRLVIRNVVAGTRSRCQLTRIMLRFVSAE